MSPPGALLAAILTLAVSIQSDVWGDEVQVTAVVGGAGGEWAAAALRELVAARLRRCAVPARAVPPPAPCRAAPLAVACRHAVLRQLSDGPLAVALLPLPLQQVEGFSSWSQRDAGIADLGDATARPLRFQCVAPPPARSLLDLADAAVAARYRRPRGPCADTRCNATGVPLLVSDETDGDQLKASLQRHSIQSEIFVVKENSLSNFLNSEPSIICDFAPELGLSYPRNWNTLGPPPCVDTVCLFEGKRIAKLVNFHKLLHTVRAIDDVLSLEPLEVEEFRSLCDHARNTSIKTAIAGWLETHKQLRTWREVRTAVLVPNVSWVDAAYEQKGLKSAAVLAERGAPNSSFVRFKVELQARCSPQQATAFLDYQRNSMFGQLSAMAGPACGAGWRGVARTAAAHGLPLLAYNAQPAPGGAALLAAGTPQDLPAALGAWLAAHNWSRLALLAPSDHIKVAAPALRAHLAVNIVLDEPDVELKWEVIDQWASRAAEVEARILYVWSEDVSVVARALCRALRHALSPAAGAVLLLPPLSPRALLAAARPHCDAAPMLDGSFTAAPAWRAAWDAWDAPAAAAPAARAAPADPAAPPLSAAAALLYDTLTLWFAALVRVITDQPHIVDNLHESNVVRQIMANATGHDYRGLTGKFEWRAEKDNAWARSSTMVIAQWDGANNTWRQVATWDGATLVRRSGALRWRTADGRAPDDGGAPCGVRAVARALRLSCGAAWALAGLCAGAAALLALLAAALGWRRRAERSFRRRLAALGLHALPPAGADRWEVPRERVVINRKLGTGAFGTVYGGHALLGERGWSAVAVKTLKPGASTEEKLDFLAEAEAMKRLDHKNVVRLLGVVTKTEPVCTVMEFMLYGDLKTYLLARRHVADECEVGARRLTAMALDAARALSYLAEARWVHRDVAARNCLVSARRVLKLADFGMARRVYDDDYYRLRRRGMLPVRWMAPEALAAGEFSAASDVWAFGVLLYEMVTLGALPFAGLSNAEVLARVQAGRALQPPPGTKPPLEALMRACWAGAARARPAAAEVAAFLAEQPRLVAPVAAPPLDALPLAHAQHAAALWRAHDAHPGDNYLAPPPSAATDTTYLSDARDTDRFLADDAHEL